MTLTLVSNKTFALSVPLLFFSLSFSCSIFTDTHSRHSDDAYVHAVDEGFLMDADDFFFSYTSILFCTDPFFSSVVYAIYTDFFFDLAYTPCFCSLFSVSENDFLDSVLSLYFCMDFSFFFLSCSLRGSHVWQG